MSAIVGNADLVPAEPRWTHALADCQEALLRNVAHSVCLECFPGDGQQEPAMEVTMDGEAAGDHQQTAHRTRVAMTMSHYGGQGQMHELVVLTAHHRLYISLPSLGKNSTPDDRGPRCTMCLALGKATPLVGAFTERLLQLLQHWRGLVDWKPWGRLDTRQPPGHESNFRHFARSQLFRTAGAFCKRCEGRINT